MRTTQLPLADLERALVALRAMGVRGVEVSGGEPFLRRDLPELLALLDRLGLLFTFNTNGTAITDAGLAALARSRGLLQVAMSLDSLDRERYRLLRGRDQLEAALAGLDRLRAARLPATLKLNFAMSRHNETETPDLLAFARARGLFLSVFPVNQGPGAHRSHRGDAFAPATDERARMAGRFEELATLRRRGEPLWEPSAFYRAAARFLRGERLDGCGAGRLYADLRADGTLAPCVELPAVATLDELVAGRGAAALASAQEAVARCRAATPCCYTCTVNLAETGRHPLSFAFETARVLGLARWRSVRGRGRTLLSGSPSDGPVVVAGAGPAGLTAALALSRAGREVVVVEREAVVGGLARTIERDGYRFDLGGHRFFTRVPEVRATLGGAARRGPAGPPAPLADPVPRAATTTTRSPPGAPSAASARSRARGSVASYLAAKLAPRVPETTLADWLVNRFGARLFETFFRTYTEKVWGQPCETIGAQWAAQRIKGMSLRAAVAGHAPPGLGRPAHPPHRVPLPPPRPRHALGADARAGRGGRGPLPPRSPRGRGQYRGRAGAAGRGRGVQGRSILPASDLVSTIPLRDLAAALRPALPGAIAAAAASLRYRDFLTVALVLEGPVPSPTPGSTSTTAGSTPAAIQNFRAGARDLVPVPGRTSLGMEYFCTAGDAPGHCRTASSSRWRCGDFAALGFGRRARVVAGHVVRVRDAYPVYDGEYGRERRDDPRGARGALNLQTVGRNGMHRYNNWTTRCSPASSRRGTSSARRTTSGR